MFKNNLIALIDQTFPHANSLFTSPARKDNAVFQFMDKKRFEGKHFYVYMTAAANKFLRIYYARVTEHLNSLQVG